MPDKKANLKSEKWTDAEVKRVAKILLEAEKKKHILIRLLDEVVHWMLLLLVLLGNIFLAAFIVIVSSIITPTYSYILIVVIGSIFGFLIDAPLKEMKKLSKKKHKFSKILLPVLAILNIFIIIGIKNTAEHFTNLEFAINPIIAGILYGVSFLIPHIFWRK